MYQIDIQKCSGCAVCVDVCEVGAIYLVNRQAHIDNSRCTACGKCVTSCPTAAISVVPDAVTTTAATTPGRPSLLAAVKSILGTIGSAVLPILISKIGDSLTAKAGSTGATVPAPGPRRQDYNRGNRHRRRSGRRL